MPAAVDFYFDFSSPYGYFASTRIDELAARHGRDTAWRPILLGPVFKAVGTSPLVSYPIKGRYVAHDFARFARLLGVPLTMPANFPFGALAASRAFYWIDDRDKAQAKAFAQAVFRAGLGAGILANHRAEIDQAVAGVPGVGPHHPGIGLPLAGDRDDIPQSRAETVEVRRGDPDRARRDLLAANAQDPEPELGSLRLKLGVSVHVVRCRQK